MGNCIHTLLCKNGNKVGDLWMDEASTEKAKKGSPAGQKTGRKRCVKITLTRKQLELLLLLLNNGADGISVQLPESLGSCKRKWKPSLQTIVEVDDNLRYSHLAV
ncbi:hypothetical protein AALP_AA8G262800 [Arabis alpina]|uniref:Uncharacterized protein n=1 Tax=Arabis alpina TaxID=50452 RepID=A0A087G9J5_ARAAL|nr:hypothetical protein AALP_AA8G262800 [Arabis alpina]